MGDNVRWLVVGARGMLGTDLVDRLEADGREVTALDLPALDILDLDGTLERVAGQDVVVNCAAFTDVDQAEEAEPLAFAVNAVGATNLARAAVATGARLVHISTDYVFAGDASTPYAEDAALAPRSAYGRTKAAGEWGVLATAPDSIVLRIAWLYGAHGRNFLATMARLAGERDTLTVVDDQAGQPTWTVDVADRICALVDTPVPGGAWHGTSGGSTTWWGFAQAIFSGLALDPGRVRPVTTEQLSRPAPRPAYSVLGHDRWAAAGLPAPRDWRESLAEALPLVVGATS